MAGHRSVAATASQPAPQAAFRLISQYKEQAEKAAPAGKGMGLPRDAGRKMVRTAWGSPTRQTGGPVGEVVGSEHPEQDLFRVSFVTRVSRLRHPGRTTASQDAGPAHSDS